MDNNSRFIQEKARKRITSLHIELRNIFYPITPMKFDITKIDNVYLINIIYPCIKYLEMNLNLI